MFDKLADRLVTSFERGATALERIADALTRDTVSGAADVAAPAASNKEPGKAPGKTTPKTTPAAAAAPTKPVVEAKGTTPAATEPTFDYEVLKAAVIQLASTGAPGKAATMGVLSEFKVARASEAPASQWEAIHKRILEEQVKLTAPATTEEDFA